MDDAARAAAVLLTRDGEPLARIVPLHNAPARRRTPGSARGLIHMADDFDSMPKELEPYLQPCTANPNA